METILLLIILQQGTANWISNATVYSNITLDTIDSFNKDDKKKAFFCQAARLAVNNAANQAAKRFIHKDRPDHSDNKSFYSSHTSNAFVSSGWRWEFGIPIAITTGGLRIAAKKHDIIDVSVGALSGYLSTLVCKKE